MGLPPMSFNPVKWFIWAWPFNFLESVGVGAIANSSMGRAVLRFAGIHGWKATKWVAPHAWRGAKWGGKAALRGGTRAGVSISRAALGTGRIGTAARGGAALASGYAIGATVGTVIAYGMYGDEGARDALDLYSGGVSPSEYTNTVWDAVTSPEDW